MAIGGLLSEPYAGEWNGDLKSSEKRNLQNKPNRSNLQLPGRPGGRGLGKDSLKAASPSTGNPKICSSSLASGGGIGKRPMAISTRDKPMLQMSDWTE